MTRSAASLPARLAHLHDVSREHREAAEQAAQAAREALDAALAEREAGESKGEPPSPA